MQGTISTSQHIGLPGGSPICCEWLGSQSQPPALRGAKEKPERFEKGKPS